MSAETPPTPSPSTTRPTSIITYPLASAAIAMPIVKMTPRSPSVARRPIRSATDPALARDDYATPYPHGRASEARLRTGRSLGRPPGPDRPAVAAGGVARAGEPRF